MLQPWEEEIYLLAAIAAYNDVAKDAQETENKQNNRPRSYVVGFEWDWTLQGLF
jgi:hypothetical protein